MAELFPTSGTEIVDELKALQYLTDKRSLTPSQKFDRIRKGAATLALHELLARQFFVNADTVLGQHPDASPNTLQVFRHGMVFVGVLDASRYMYDEDVPLDSLMLDFVEPDILEIETEDIPHFKEMRLMIPVLAITTCLDTDMIA